MEKAQLIEMVWDAYKDVHGIRPRHIDMESMTVEALQTMLTELLADN